MVEPDVRTASDFLVEMERGKEMRPPAPTLKSAFSKVCLQIRTKLFSTIIPDHSVSSCVSKTDQIICYDNLLLLITFINDTELRPINVDSYDKY